SPGRDLEPPQRARARGVAPPRRAPRNRRDREAALHLRAHGALAREEPPAQARRVLAPRSARDARDGPRVLSNRLLQARAEAFEGRLHEARERLEVVAAFEDGGDPRSEASGAAGELAEPRRREAHRRLA